MVSNNFTDENVARLHFVIKYKEKLLSADSTLNTGSLAALLPLPYAPLYRYVKVE